MTPPSVHTAAFVLRELARPNCRIADHAASLLAPNGCVIVEDFAFADASDETISGFTRLLRRALNDERVDSAALTGTFAEELLRDGPSAWHRSHAHDVRSVSTMQAALEKRFLLTLHEPVPYLYRYGAAVFPRTAAGAEYTRSVFDEELTAARLGRIDLVGRRFVGRQRRV